MTDPEYTSAELDAIIELPGDPGYQLVAARIASEIERTRTALEKPADQLATADLRGYVRALRTLQSLPEILRSEIERAINKQA